MMPQLCHMHRSLAEVYLLVTMTAPQQPMQRERATSFPCGAPAGGIRVKASLIVFKTCGEGRRI